MIMRKNYLYLISLKGQMITLYHCLECLNFGLACVHQAPLLLEYIHLINTFVNTQLFLHKIILKMIRLVKTEEAVNLSRHLMESYFLRKDILRL